MESIHRSTGKYLRDDQTPKHEVLREKTKNPCCGIEEESDLSGIENDRRIETKRQISLQISRRYLMKGMRKQKWKIPMTRLFKYRIIHRVIVVTTCGWRECICYTSCAQQENSSKMIKQLGLQKNWQQTYQQSSRKEHQPTARTLCRFLKRF